MNLRSDQRGLFYELVGRKHLRNGQLPFITFRVEHPGVVHDGGVVIAADMEVGGREAIGAVYTVTLADIEGADWDIEIFSRYNP